MAPAIVHFLIGAALLLTVAVPVILRYEIDREHAVWLVPLGGIWGLTPDVHNIAPVFVESLYAFHNAPVADLFAFHYTLDRSTVRAQYEASVFGSITIFLIAIVGFWTAGRVRRVTPVARRPLEQAFVVVLATGLASILATVALWIVVSIQSGFPLAAGLVGRSSTLAGGLLTILAGGGFGMVSAVLLEVALPEPTRTDPVSTAGVGLLLGVGVWLLAVPVSLAVVTESEVPLLHLGSLVALVGYGVVFGSVYGMVRGAFSVCSPAQVDSRASKPYQGSN
ncbi:hypothetical protein [Halorubrum sp. DTA46]|uniref:hypothetical protein n=1 Tax=Halorubrum sp. DTA46 TaxID=3402162 RepID=UPI003AAE7A7B